VIRFDDKLGKYVVIIDGILVGTFDQYATAKQHMRLLNS